MKIVSEFASVPAQVQYAFENQIQALQKNRRTRHAYMPEQGENTMKKLRLFAGFTIAATLAGCGGGGTDNASTYTYFQQGGLTWSSTSAQQICTDEFNQFGTNCSFDQSANFFCSGSVNGAPANFNKTAGWRLPTVLELQNLYKAMPKPPGWVIGRIWNSGGSGTDFSNGNGFSGGLAYVTCVK